MGGCLLFERPAHNSWVHLIIYIGCNPGEAEETSYFQYYYYYLVLIIVLFISANQHGDFDFLHLLKLRVPNQTTDDKYAQQLSQRREQCSLFYKCLTMLELSEQ